MQLEEISSLLKEETRGFNLYASASNPYQIANFLLCCGDILLKYVEYSNQQLNADSKGFVSTAEMEKIHFYFQELGQNFFPMAHTSENLSGLQIVDKQRCTQLQSKLRYILLQHASLMEECSREADDMLRP